MLSDRVAEETRRPGPKNALQKVIDERPDLADELVELMKDRSTSASALSRALRNEGLDVSRGVIERWRRGETHIVVNEEEVRA